MMLAWGCVPGTASDDLGAGDGDGGGVMIGDAGGDGDAGGGDGDAGPAPVMCEDRDGCAGLERDICRGDGLCVECTRDDDCDAEVCDEGPGTCEVGETDVGDDSLCGLDALDDGFCEEREAAAFRCATPSVSGIGAWQDCKGASASCIAGVARE